jgi:GNAT superfamily N-acetyltransferase
MITFALEPWRDFVNDPQRETLWREHYDELAGDKARMPLGVDNVYYSFLDMNGMLQITTARSAGVLVGYVLMVVKPHPRYCTVLTAFEDCYFLTLGERKKGVGARLVDEAERNARARGAKLCYFMTKLAADHSELFKAAGYKATDLVFAKWIGAEPPLEE